jgi:protein TonB
VSFDDWARSQDHEDADRARRVIGSYATAFVVVGALLGLGIAFGGQIKKQVFEEEVTVRFVPSDPVKAPAPPPPVVAPAPPPPRIGSLAKPALGQRRNAPPTELPRNAPVEGDPNDAKDASPLGEGDPNGVLGGTGTGTVAPPVTPPPAAPTPPVQFMEASTPPVALAKAMPAYPDDARKQGIEALIVVKFIVNERGTITDPEVLKGHPLFDAIVLEAVRAWTFEPATLAGKAVRTARLVKIPFRLKHH